MKPLSKEASAALSALKATDPSAADEARVRKNLERALGVAIPTATVAVATTAQAAVAISVGAKAVAFIVAVGVGTAITLSSLSPRGGEGRGEGAKLQPVARPEKVEFPPKLEIAPEPEPIVVAVAPPPSPPPTRARPPQPPPEVAPVAAPEPTPVVVQPTAEVLTPPPPPPLTEATVDLEVEANFPNCDSATEMRSAQSARKLLNGDRSEEAVWLLGAYQRRCPSGRWSDEAWTVRMAGLCRLGRNSEVTGLLQWFSAEYPARRAAVLSELRSFCPAEVLKHGEPTGD